MRKCRELAGSGVVENEVRRALDELLSNKLMVEMNGKYLSLAVFRARKTVDRTPLAGVVDLQRGYWLST